MKKYMNYIMTLFLIIIFIILTIVLDNLSFKKSPINFYIFYSDTCEYCQTLHEYTDSLKNDKEISQMFEIVDYEIKETDNKSLMKKIANYFNTEVKGVPFYVIGDKYFFGFSDNKIHEIVTQIKNSYNNKKYQDIVDNIKNDKKLEKEKSKNVPGIIITLLLIIIVIIIIIASIKNINNEDIEKRLENSLFFYIILFYNTLS